MSPFSMVFFGVFGSAATNLAMSFLSTPILLTVIWGLNGLFQSLLWAPIIYILSSVLIDGMRQKASLWIGTTVPVGTIITYLISMLVLNKSNWRTLFIVSSIALFVVSALWLINAFITKPLLQDHDENYHIKLQNVISSDQGKGLIPLLLGSGVMVFLIPAFFHGIIKEGINTWIPTMIGEVFSVSTVFSLFLSMFLPVVSISGSYIITYLYNKKLHQNEATSSIVAMLSVVPSLIFLLFLEKTSIIINVILLALVITSMRAFNHLAITLIPVRFARLRRTSAVSGVINSVTYLGSALAAFGFGWIAERWSWRAVIIFCLTISVVGVVVCIVFKTPWSNFLKRLERLQTKSEKESEQSATN